MSIDYSKLKGREFAELRHTYTRRDTMLYALGLGAPEDAMDMSELRFVYEKDLVALPTMAAVLCTPGFWLGEPDTGVDPKMVLHAEQSIELHSPIRPEGTVLGRTMIDEIIDKGEGRGAILYQRRELHDADGGAHIASVSQSTFVRGEGGFSGAQGPLKPVHPIPDRAPDETISIATRPDLALLYRLSGDYNPLHADPERAHAAGFDRPILHGLCTYGIAGRAILRALCGNQPERLRRLDARFSAPVLPGDTIVAEVWRDPSGRHAFRCSAGANGQVVLNNGLAVVNEC